MQVWTKVLIAGAALAVILGTAAGYLLSHVAGLPEVTALEVYKPSATTRVFSDDGELLAEFYMENRTPVPLDRLSLTNVIEAFLAVEDPRFYSHSGIDFSAYSARCSRTSGRQGRPGRISITQQLAKMIFLEPEKTLSRKMKEAYLALQIERHYSKDEILDLYLNQVYLGSGAYGVEAAAHTYFGKSVGKLTLGEGAILAGLPAAPTRYSPLNDLQPAYSRRAHVLRRMVAEGFIDKGRCWPPRRAFREHTGKKEQFKAPYFVEYIRRKLDEKYGETTLYKGGLNVYTTLNDQMQQMAEAAVENGLQEVDKRHHRDDQQIQGALLAIEPHTGYIRAMVGGRDFSKSQFNRSIQALRQPGSAFKPIVYAAALDKGFGPDDTIMDAPVSYPGARAGVRWSPTNFDEKFEGQSDAPARPGAVD